jgi:hypothetical protein
MKESHFLCHPEDMRRRTMAIHLSAFLCPSSRHKQATEQADHSPS